MHSNPRKYLQSILTTDNRIPFTSSNGFNGNKYLVDKYSNISATENTPSSATAANSWSAENHRTSSITTIVQLLNANGSRYRQLTDSHRNTDQHNQHADHYQAHTAAQWYGNINEPSCISRKNQRAKTYMNRRETDGHKQLRHSQQLLLILLQLRHSQQQLLILLQLRNTAAG